jgi:hypothetical protein
MDDSGDRLDWPRRGLGGRARRIVLALTQALLCDEDGSGRIVPARPGLCERVTEEFDHAVGRGSSDLRRGYAVLSFVLEWLPLLVVRTPSRMSKLPLEARLRYLEALEGSRVGLLTMLFVAFKVPLCIPAFEQGEELASTGFDRPTTVARRRLPAAPRPPREATP